jgi:molybdenum cofactor biosynthesis enzyme MoaA
MPKEVYGRDFAFLPRDQVLTFEEIVRLAGLFAAEGVEKLRITGGEPLARMASRISSRCWPTSGRRTGDRSSSL